MSSDAIIFIRDKLKSGDIFEKITAAYYLTSSQDYVDLDLFIEISQKMDYEEGGIDKEDVREFLFTYCIIGISNIISNHPEFLNENRTKEIQKIVLKVVNKYLFEGVGIHDMVNYYLAREFEKLAEFLKWEPDQLFDKGKIYADTIHETENFDKFLLIWQDTKEHFYESFFSTSSNHFKNYILYPIEVVGEKILDNSIADFLVKVIKSTDENKELHYSAISTYEYVKKDPTYQTNKEFPLEKYIEKRRKFYQKKAELKKKEEEKRKAEVAEKEAKEKLHSDTLTDSNSEKNWYKTLKDVMIDPERIKEVKKELENFFQDYETPTGENLLAKYKENDLYEEVITIFVEIYDALLSIHRSDYYNFLFHLENRDKIPPATKQDIEKFKKELPEFLKEYKKTIDEMLEEIF